MKTVPKENADQKVKLETTNSVTNILLDRRMVSSRAEAILDFSAAASFGPRELLVSCRKKKTAGRNIP